MENSATIRKLQKKQGELADRILNQMKVGSDEIAASLYKYRAMADVIAQIEKDQDDDDDAQNRL